LYLQDISFANLCDRTAAKYFLRKVGLSLQQNPNNVLEGLSQNKKRNIIDNSLISSISINQSSVTIAVREQHQQSNNGSVSYGSKRINMPAIAAAAVSAEENCRELQ
jgi:hypothetical protein